MANTDSATLEGTQGQPSSESSNNGAGQRSSEPEFVTLEQFKAIQDSLDKVLRTVQSDKDRAVKKVSSRLETLEGSLKDVLKSAATQGRSVEELLAEVEKDEQRSRDEALLDIVNEWRESRSRTFASDGGRGSSSTDGVDISEVLAGLDLDTADTRVKEFAGKRWTSKEDAYREGAKLVKQIYTHKPTEADLPSNPARDRAQSADRQTELMSEYLEGSKNLRGNALINYKIQMRSKGLDIS